MMPGVHGVATEPVARAAGLAPVPAGYLEALEDPDAAGQYLVEISAYKGGEARSGGLATVAEIPVSAHPKNSGVDVGQVTLLYADRHWIGPPLSSDPSFAGGTTKANVFYEGRVTVPIDISRAMPLEPEDDRRSRRQFGEIEIANGDGAMDPILQSYAVDGRRVRVLYGPYMGAYADFRAVADVLGAGWEGDETAVRIALRDQGFSLDLPLQETLYAGSGGAEGTAEIEGQPKPLLFGRCRNVTPTLVDPANLIYQLHDGSIEAVDAVYDRGAAVTASGNDAADYTALAALSVSAGQYATALDSGLFKLGSLPSGLVTADARGDNSPDYQNTLDTIALRILEDRHGLASRWIDTGSFAGAAAIGGELGIYIPSTESPSTADVLSRLMAATAGWWGAARDGRIRAGRLTAPENRSANLVLDSYDIVDLRPEDTPIPRWRQRVGFTPNWTIQRGEDLAASVSAARRQFLTSPFSVVSSADATVRTRHRQALDPAPLPGLYENESDASSLASTLQTLFGADRQVFRVTLKRLGFQIDLGRIAQITWPRYGLQNGKKFVVLGIVDRATPSGDEVVLRVWG